MTANKPEHYFSAQPSGSFTPHEIQVRLAHQDYTVVTAGGVFSPEHIDAGTQVLLFSVPTPPSTGNLLDLGCGWGPLALTMALESPQASVYAVDVNERALELTLMNAQRLGLKNVTASTPDALEESIRFETIWSNPPIRVGKAELHSMMQRWIPRLASGGTAYLVVAKHLGAESLEKWLRIEFAGSHSVRRSATRRGFRIIAVTAT